MATKTLMKDGLGSAAVERIFLSLTASGAQIEQESFSRDALNGLEDLELKERVQHLISVLAIHLPNTFPDAAIILGNIRTHWKEGKADDSFQLFAAWPIIDYVAEYGQEHPDVALPLLRYLTPLFSAEFAIRPFLAKHPELTYQTMLEWCNDSDEHVRRLASEGIRPRLPWGKQLPAYIADPVPVIELLENLKDDPSEYVRRSVANNLNDISKDHPDKVIETCRRWLATPNNIQPNKERQWIVRHATRTLVKAGHPQVFPLLGHTQSPQITTTKLQLSSDNITLGESLQISTAITSISTEKQSIVVDYAIHFMKANGKTAPKVFKWKNLKLAPHESVTISKKHIIKAISTRRYYSGTQHVELLINGVTVDSRAFELNCE